MLKEPFLEKKGQGLFPQIQKCDLTEKKCNIVKVTVKLGVSPRNYLAL